jgi:hypothetical protein
MRYGSGTLIPEPAAQFAQTPELLTPTPVPAGTCLNLCKFHELPPSNLLDVGATNP